MNIDVLTVQDLALIKEVIIKELMDSYAKSKKGKTWLRSEEAAEYLKCTLASLKHLRLTGQIPYTKIGNRCFYSVEDIEALLEKNKMNDGNKREESQGDSQSPNGNT